MNRTPRGFTLPPPRCRCEEPCPQCQRRAPWGGDPYYDPTSRHPEDGLADCWVCKREFWAGIGLKSPPNHARAESTRRRVDEYDRKMMEGAT